MNLIPFTAHRAIKSLLESSSARPSPRVRWRLSGIASLAIGSLATALVAGLPSMDACATDPFRESELVGEVTSRYGRDETVWLNAEGRRFAAMMRDSSARQTLGGVALLHGIEESPDAPNLIQALRKALPVRGWTSLSLVAPVREAGADIDAYLGLMAESVGRLTAGVAYLNDKQTVPIAVVGHRSGALAVVRYLAQHPDAKAAAAVLVDLPVVAAAEMETEMPRIRTPMLDIVTDTAKRGNADWALKRKGLMKNNDRYRQVVIADAGTKLQALEEMLVNRIHGWLKRELRGDESDAGDVP